MICLHLIFLKVSVTCRIIIKIGVWNKIKKCIYPRFINFHFVNNIAWHIPGWVLYYSLAYSVPLLWFSAWACHSHSPEDTRGQTKVSSLLSTVLHWWLIFSLLLYNYFKRSVALLKDNSFITDSFITVIKEIV